uniref:Uncharacterized protein n=1 Tax=viral metagenome TaxID=1070528 RepID=A0A6C0EII0_9ZZZZ
MKNNEKNSQYKWLNTYHISKIKEAFTKNYLTFIVMFASCVMLCYENIGLGLMYYVFCTHLSYFIHILAHEDSSKTINVVHEYHHNYIDNYGHYLQILLELSTAILPIFVIYMFTGRLYIKNTFEPYVIFMFSLFYSSIHNINYSVLHVNKIHENHHKDWTINYGPDICDVLYGTKENYEELENTSHYIPNLLICTMIAKFLQYKIPKIEYNLQQNLYSIVKMLYLLSYVGLIIFNQTLLMNDEKKHLDIFNNEVANLLNKIKLAQLF